MKNSFKNVNITTKGALRLSGGILYTVFLLLSLTLLMIIYWIIEYSLHHKYLKKIPIRIHVNGTRGKSSVSRLIGAGLRENGFKTITKVTGTKPKLILDDGSESPIYRKGPANIIEQLSIIKFASEKKAEVLVVECMALQPEYQRISEEKMIRSTIGVITNVRSDHHDVMGPTVKDVGIALSNTVPSGSNLFFGDESVPKQISDKCKTNNTKLHSIDLKSISEKDMKGFKYFEHKENVALALKVCKHLGVRKNIALRGMYNTKPDVGALMKYSVKSKTGLISFFNAFAANDPDSSLMIWNMLKTEKVLSENTFILLNTRKDRLYRSRQLLKMVGENIVDEISAVILIGDSHEMTLRSALKNGIGREKIIEIKSRNISEIFNKIITLSTKNSTILALGNMGGLGGSLSDYFKNRGNREND